MSLPDEPLKASALEGEVYDLLLLFDLDDTVTPKGTHITGEYDANLGLYFGRAEAFRCLLKTIRKKYKTQVAVLSTTGIANATAQLKEFNDMFDYILVENGLVSRRVLKKTNELEMLEDIGFQEMCDSTKIKEMIIFAKAYMRGLFGIENKEFAVKDNKALDGVKVEPVLNKLFKKYQEFSIATDLEATFDHIGKNSKESLWKTSSINFSPIGTNKNRKLVDVKDSDGKTTSKDITYPEYRKEFSKLNSPDEKHTNVILGPFREALEAKFGNINMSANPESPFLLEFNIGGSTGVDVFPIGWNKTYGYYFMKKLTMKGRVIRGVPNGKEVPPDKKMEPGEEKHPIKDTFNHVIFFGDNALNPKGNDYAVCQATGFDIFPNDVCVPVKTPNNTIAELKKISEMRDLDDLGEYIKTSKIILARKQKLEAERLKFERLKQQDLAGGSRQKKAKKTQKRKSRSRKTKKTKKKSKKSSGSKKSKKVKH